MDTPDREFAPGDRVRQKIGGPVMTVQDVYDPVFYYRYRCVWAEADGFLQCEVFRAEQLEPAPPEA